MKCRRKYEVYVMTHRNKARHIKICANSMREAEQIALNRGVKAVYSVTGLKRGKDTYEETIKATHRRR